MSHDFDASCTPIMGSPSHAVSYPAPQSTLCIDRRIQSIFPLQLALTLDTAFYSTLHSTLHSTLTPRDPLSLQCPPLLAATGTFHHPLTHPIRSQPLTDLRLSHPTTQPDHNAHLQQLQWRRPRSARACPATQLQTMLRFLSKSVGETPLRSGCETDTSSLDGPTVEVLVQDYRLPDATSFHCHVSVLCQSPWFKKALDPEAAGENRPVKTIDISEHCNDHEVFKLYQSYLYRKAIAPGTATHEYKVYVFVRAYVLGEKFSDQAFKQAIFDRFLTDYENLPSLSAQVDNLSLLRLIRYHNEISLSSRLYKLVMDLFITKTPALSKDDLAYVPDKS
jgi:hypothetical protein